MAIDNAINMNDDDFMRAMESHQENQEQEEVEGSFEDTPEDSTVNTETDTTQENDDSNADTELGNEGEEQEQSQEQVNQESSNSASDTETNETDTTTATTDEIDYKQFYETVTQDFKAAGKIIPGVKEPEKFIKALQMATDYALKTAALKPVMRKAKMLEDVTDEELAEMLDFRARNPEVIKKALKDANMDPIDIDLDTVNYQPQSKVMSDADYEFHEVLSNIQKSEKYPETQKIILQELDEASRHTVLKNPALLATFHNEVESGRMAQIQAQALQLKAFGNYQNVKDIDLFAMIAQQMDQQASQNQGAVSTQVANPTQTKQTRVSKPNSAELDDKRARAGIKTKPVTTAVKKYDPTKLTDEQFMQLMSEGAEFI